MIETKIGKIIKVLIGQVSLTHAPNQLQSVLGSCIGLAMYDSDVGIGGMAHVLLPDSNGKTPGNLPGKFANRAVPCLYEALLKHGALPKNLKAKMAGGARMFRTSMSYKNQDIGASNIKAVKDALLKLHIPLVSAETGGESGRKIEFDLFNYRLVVGNFSKRKEIL